MERLTKRYPNGRVTLDAAQFPPYTQETIDCEIRAFEPTCKAVERLAEYEDSEEKGLLVRLPCKVGDTVWVLRKGGYNLMGLHRGWDYYVDKIRFNYHALDLYDEFYTTHEEAERALKEIAE